MRQAEQVESLRAELGKARTLMLFRMNRILTPEQRVEVQRAAARRRDRGATGGPGATSQEVVPTTAAISFWRHSVNRFSSSFRFACLAVVGVLLGSCVSPPRPSRSARRGCRNSWRRPSSWPDPSRRRRPGRSPRPRSRPVINLTMDDAVKMTIDQNIDISVQRLNPQIQDFALAQARAAYRPTAAGTFGDRAPGPRGRSQISGGAVVDTGTLHLERGRQPGDPVDRRDDLTSTSTTAAATPTSNNATLNPSYSANLQFSGDAAAAAGIARLTPTASRSRRRRSPAAWRMSP